MTVLMPSDCFVLLENSRDPRAASFLFEQPERIVRCDDPAGIEAALEAIQAGLDEGLFAAGWLSYEVGYALEPRLRPLMPSDRREPLIWFGLFRRRRRLDRADVELFWRERTQGTGYTLSPLQPVQTREGYLEAFARIQDWIAAGDVYQINLTMDAAAAFDGDPLALHAALRQAQPVSHGAFLAAGDWCVSSHSPELFLSRAGDQVTVKPMKGTAARGRWFEEDEAAKAALSGDAKSRAENLMIVDLERNDLSRMALPGSVSAEDLFHVDAYPTVLQMISTVRGAVPPATRSLDLLRSVFPCGSVTGAPKIRAMEIIAALEQRPRGVYTGAIGHISPDGDAAFSVPIRTLVVDAGGTARMGIGSGVVADSDGPAEWDECLLKAAFLAAPQARPALIETLLWDRDSGWWLLEDHLARLRESAAYFVYPFDDSAVRGALEMASDSFPTGHDQRVRLLLSPAGAVSVTATTLDVRAGREALDSAPPSVAWASTAVRSSDPFLFHKTTRRALYDRAMTAAARDGHWDLLFHNERGEVTEGARSTLFVYRDGNWLTPPLDSGVLPGVFRRHFMARNTVREQVLTRADLESADRICVANAVWGLIEVRLSSSIVRL
ncbi:aminodeoxychorismate synthase component I [Iodidimonas sp. SYSU 1G8]|uniref:aminodeoxychorismate synthase component I n=1 Tax=Iodidimonas sp. SYSU 1G8 TaxID=3133967 RepID=UPI0031FF1367